MQELEIQVGVRPVDGRNLTDWFQPLDGNVFPQLVHPYRWRCDQGHASVNADNSPQFAIWGLYGARDKERADCYKVTMALKRESRSVFTNVILTTVVISLMASTTFFMEDFSDQINTLITALLAVGAFQSQLSDSVLPNSPSPFAIEL